MVSGAGPQTWYSIQSINKHIRWRFNGSIRMTIVLEKCSVEKLDFDLKELSTTLVKQRIHIFKVKKIYMC